MTKFRGDDGEIDDAVARYREQLAREADVGRATLDEIEDHLRSLVDDLRATGMPAALAIGEAAKRLGDPSQIAREHARVRTAFGAKLPLWRALAVIVLVMPQLIGNLTSPSWIDTGCGVLGLVLCGALTWRSAWSRAALFGAMAWSIVWAIASLALGRQPETWMLALQLAAFGLLAPWRRTDLTATGWAIALLYPMFSAAASLLYIDITSTGGDGSVPSMWFAAIGVVATGAGLVLRARWAAVSAWVSTFVLTCWFWDTFELYYDFGIGRSTLTMTACAVAAGIAVAILASRTARSNLGDLKNVLA